MPSLTYWQGRATELAAIQSWLADPLVGLVGITGLGGFGKSTLAAKLCATAPGFVGWFWVDLSQELSFPQMARRLLYALGMPAPEVDAIEEPEIGLALVRALQGQRFLVVLDNLESLLDQQGGWRSLFYEPFLQTWLGCAAQSKLLITSRERPMGLEGRWYNLVEGLSGAEGEALLRQRGVRGEAAALQQVSERVGGYPLSLMLLSGWLVAEEPDPQVEYLPQDLWQLAGRHRGLSRVSVEQVFDWSLERLSLELRQLLCQTAVLRGGFNRLAAAWLTAESEETSDASVLDEWLQILVRRSLLQRLPGRDRFGLKAFQFQPQVQTLLQRQANGGEVIKTHQRAVAYYRQQLQRLQQQEQREAETASFYEHLELFHHLCELGDYEAAVRFITEAPEQSDSCDWFLQLRGYQSTRLELYERLVANWQPTAPQARIYYANCLQAKADVLQFLKQCDAAIALYDEAIEVYKAVGDRLGYANCLQAKADVLQFLKQCDAAIALYDEAIEVYKAVGARLGYANCLRAKADVLQFLDQREAAIALYDEAIEVYKAVGDRLGYANTLLGLGQTLDNPAEALEHYWQAQAVYVEIGDRYSQGRNLRWFIITAQINLGQIEAAITSLTELAEIGEAIGMERWQTYALDKIAELRGTDAAE